ncbi:UNVERIFIED_CONTAM: hypothetical protein LK11_22580 [Mumia flava]
MCETCSTASGRSFDRRTLLGGAAATAAATAAAQFVTAPAAAAAPAGGQTHDLTGMSVRLLGTAGGPVWYPGTDRAGTSTAVVVDGAVYLFDCGDGSLRRFREAGLGSMATDFAGFENLRTVFLTHLHPDHYLDLPGLLLFAPVLGLTKGAFDTIGLYGPGSRGVLPPVDPRLSEPDLISPAEPLPGTSALVDHMIAGSATSLNESMRDTGRADVRHQVIAHDVALPSSLLVDPNQDTAPSMAPFVVYEDDRVRVSATLVPHGVTFPAFGYRVESEHGVVAISGDTAASSNVVALAADADVLIHEVVDPAWAEGVFPQPRNPRQDALVSKLVDSHTPVGEVGRVADEAGARNLVLSHLSPANWPAGRWRRQVRRKRGLVTVGHDLDLVRVRPGSDRH